MDLNKILRFVCTILGISFLILFLLGFVQFTRDVLSHRETKYVERELVQIINRPEANGSFFLASGQINEQNYYQFYYKDRDGFIIYRKENAEHGKAKIRFSDKPKLIIEYIGNNEFGWKEKGIIIEVPESSILRNYNLNLKE